MSVLICSGFQPSWCEFAQSRLGEMGVSSAEEAKRIEMGATDILDAMSKTYKVSVERSKKFRQIAPGKTWQYSVAELFMANTDNEVWGFADPRNIFFLQFWLEFDPESRFVLLYGSPEQHLAKVCHDTGKTPDQLSGEMDRWADYHQEMIRFYHENTDRCMLIHVNAFEDKTGEIAKGLNAQFEIEARLINTQESLGEDAISLLAARTALEDDQDFALIFEDMEVCADIPMIDAVETKALTGKIFEEFNDMSGQLATSKEKLTEAENMLETVKAELQKERDDQVMALALRSELENELTDKTKKLVDLEAEIQKERDDHIMALAKHSEFSAEYKTLLKQKDQEMQSISDERHRLLQDLESTREDLKKAQTQFQASDGQDTGELADQKEENSLLLLQLHQVQEELEFYFEQYQNIKYDRDRDWQLEGGANAPVKPADQEPLKAHELVEGVSNITIDLRKYVNGSGWHNPEIHGRWAGPETQSTAKLKGLSKAKHRFEMTLIDAMSLDMIKEMKLTFDGKPLPFNVTYRSDLTGALAPLRRLKSKLDGAAKPYPAKITATISPDMIRGDGRAHYLNIICPKTIKPENEGQSDPRELSICVQTITIDRVT